MRIAGRKKFQFYTLTIVAVCLSVLANLTFPHKSSALVPDKSLYVTFINVGQGDAALIRTPKDETLLIDGGEKDSFETHLLPYLKKEGIQEIDAAIVTHYHSDHAGGIYELLTHNAVESLFIPDYKDTDKTKSSLTNMAGITHTATYSISEGDIIETECDDLTIEVLNPPKGGNEGNNFHNNSSLVVKITYFGTSFLITGDIEARAEKHLIRTANLECDVLKVPHHGSSTSSTKDFLMETDPTYGIISVGSDNPYGHPHIEVLERLDDEDIRVYRTDKDGDITFEVNKKGISDIKFSL